ncbi:phenylalanine--tRNA ligase subunit alpha [Natronomonas halophila]|uniref:phenylalanine--tRNA ligase subunit alpha n=1 Tax=Natronomonas halophila TaxID=2747817 RepID=UPI0015B6FAE0|nr:phenylalanine--tRNA ligase subunit alpha [Natronomonas halophila]QLD86226.1 phenylalanine--tRNA ligase subunit alpha [Natronomonas halophila]
MRLPETQVALLEAASATETKTVAQLAEELGEDPAAVTRAAFELEDDGLVAVEEHVAEEVSLTDEGETYLEDGLPELRLYEAAMDAGADEEAVPMGQLIGASGLEGPEVDIALSNFARKGLGKIDSGEVVAEPDAEAAEKNREAEALEAISGGNAGYIDAGILDRLESRGLIEREETTVRSVTLTDEGVTAMMEGVEVAETVGAVTPELLTSGEWEDVEFTEYNVEADAETVHGGKEHILRQTANRVKDVLVGMGFQEMEGPHADAEFWINDCLFMPQDHPARTHWDQFALDVPAMESIPEDLLERVEDAHRNGVGEDGDGYHSPWTPEVAKQVDLRGHTTSLSMRYLSGFAQGDLEPPQRYFSVEKVYRNDTLDPTHLLEFFQIEGWVMAEDLSVRDLMGTFTEFYEQFGITDIEFKPHYNPYTEPSFELFGKHPETGELIEIGNSGIFREEVVTPLGVECDVMAWGLALERLLMLMYGFEDIRDVHGTLCDLELLRNVEVVQ